MHLSCECCLSVTVAVFWICFTWNLPDTSFLILACACMHARTHAGTHARTHSLKHTHTHTHTHTHSLTLTHTHACTHYTCLCNKCFNICGLKCWQGKQKYPPPPPPPQTVTRMYTFESVFFWSFSRVIRSIRNVPCFMPAKLYLFWGLCCFHSLSGPLEMSLGFMPAKLYLFLVCVVFTVYQVHQKRPSVSCLPSCTFPFPQPSIQLLLLLSVEGVLCEVPLAFGLWLWSSLLQLRHCSCMILS